MSDCLKTYLVQFAHKFGNGWAIVNAHRVSEVSSIMQNSSKFSEITIANLRELKCFGNTMSLVYEGAITTLGKTPYDLAVLNGYKGTLEEWLESLVGPQGIQGIQGNDGNPGVGIESITQIETSEDAHGVNVIRITLTDGTTQDFTVKNGGNIDPVVIDTTLIL